MGGFTNALVTAGTSLLPAATDYRDARAHYDRQVADARGEADRLQREYALDRQAYDHAEAEAARLRAQAEAEAAHRTALLEHQARLEQEAARQRAALDLETARREQSLREAQARAEAETAARRLRADQQAEQERLSARAATARQAAELAQRDQWRVQQAQAAAEARVAEATRLRLDDLRRAQADMRARFGAGGLRGSTSGQAVLAGMAAETARQNTAAADGLRTVHADTRLAQLAGADAQAALAAAERAAAAGPRDIAPDLRDIWQSVETTRRQNLLELTRLRDRAALSLTEMAAAQGYDRARLASENALSVYRAQSAGNRLLTDAWMRLRRDTLATEARAADLGAGLRPPAPADYFAPLADRALAALGR